MKIYNFEVEYFESDYRIGINEINRVFDALEISNLFNNFEDPDGTSVWMFGRGEFNISFCWTWEDEEEENFPPTWNNYHVMVRKDYFVIERMGGTCYPIPCDPGYEHIWKINWEGELLWESPSQEIKRRGRRSCRK